MRAARFALITYNFCMCYQGILFFFFKAVKKIVCFEEKFLEWCSDITLIGVSHTLQFMCLHCTHCL